MKYRIFLCIALVTVFQTTSHNKYESGRKACFASILTSCATLTLPYLCTPTSVSCLSLEPFATVHQRVETVYRHAESVFIFMKTDSAYFTIRLTSLFLTTMVLMIFPPSFSMKRAIFSSAVAAATTLSLSRSAATWMVPRSLPLT